MLITMKTTFFLLDFISGFIETHDSPNSHWQQNRERFLGFVDMFHSDGYISPFHSISKVEASRAVILSFLASDK